MTPGGLGGTLGTGVTRKISRKHSRGMAFNNYITYPFPLSPSSFWGHPLVRSASIVTAVAHSADRSSTYPSAQNAPPLN